MVYYREDETRVCEKCCIVIVGLGILPIIYLHWGGDEDNFWKDVLKKSYFFIFPISTPETLHALKLPPSALP